MGFDGQRSKENSITGGEYGENSRIVKTGAVTADASVNAVTEKLGTPSEEDQDSAGTAPSRMGRATHCGWGEGRD